MIPAHISNLHKVFAPVSRGGWKKDLTCFAATMEQTWLVQLTEMSGTSNSGYFVCLLWKGCLNGSLVTNSTWRLTSIYPHYSQQSFFIPVFLPCMCPASQTYHCNTARLCTAANGECPQSRCGFKTLACAGSVFVCIATVQTDRRKGTEM